MERNYWIKLARFKALAVLVYLLIIIVFFWDAPIAAPGDALFFSSLIAIAALALSICEQISGVKDKDPYYPSFLSIAAIASAFSFFFRGTIGAIIWGPDLFGAPGEHLIILTANGALTFGAAILYFFLLKKKMILLKENSDFFLIHILMTVVQILLIFWLPAIFISKL